jgi:AraC family transcriptional regulator
VVYRPLARTDLVEVGDYRCTGADSAGDESTKRVELIFVRAGLFRIETEHASEIVDPARSIALRAGERYRVSHPHPGVCHDRCLVLSFAPGALGDLEDTGFARHRSGRPALTRRCDGSLFLAQERFRAELSAAGSDALCAAEGALRLATELLGGTTLDRAAGRRHGAPDRRILAVQALIAERYTEQMTLAELGSAVGLSPFWLAHLFRAETGGSLHRHRLGLRLRAAATRLADGERELTNLALDLGFADHAHFTGSFRRFFGVPPSAFRRTLSRR